MAAQQVIQAWIIPPVAGAALIAAEHLLRVAAVGRLSDLSLRHFRLALFVFGFGLVFQVAYGRPAYLTLEFLGFLSLPVLVLAYVTPVMMMIGMGSDRAKDLIMGTRWVLWALTLAITTWLLIAPH